jgi:hypothetical protein
MANNHHNYYAENSITTFKLILFHYSPNRTKKYVTRLNDQHLSAVMDNVRKITHDRYSS